MKKIETLSDGCLGSEIDEGRSEMRNALRIAEFRELTDFLTRIAAVHFVSSYLPQCQLISPSFSSSYSFLRGRRRECKEMFHLRFCIVLW